MLVEELRKTENMGTIIQESSLEQRLSLINRGQHPLCPDLKIQDIGDYLLSVAKDLINIKGDKEKYVSISYHFADINPRIVRIRAKTGPDGTILTNESGEILSFNLLFVELLADMVAFQSSPEKRIFRYIMGKYSRPIASLNDENAACFFNWLYWQNKHEDDMKSHIFFQKAVAGSIFILMHEWIHSQAELLEETLKLFSHSNIFMNLSAGLSNKAIDEVCCDYSALAMISQYGFESHFDCTKTEMLGVSMMALSIPGLYEFIRGIRIDGNLDNYDQIAKDLFKVQKERIQLLAVVIKESCNSKLFFGDCNVGTAIDYALKTIERFLMECGKCYLEDISRLIQKYNSLPHDVRDEYIYSIPYQEWILFA